MEQFGELAPMVQILDAPVPQMVDKLEDVLKIVDLIVPVQEIDVPKISSLSCPLPRRVLPEPQSAEQLVEVPTVLSPLRIAEQIVGNPVPLGRGKRRVQGFPPRPSSTAPYSCEERISERIVEQTVSPSREERISERTVEQVVDIPVHGRGVSSRGGPQDFVPAVLGQSSIAFGGGLQDFLPEQVSIAFSGAEHEHGALQGLRPGQAFSGKEHRHGSLHGSRRGGGSVGGSVGGLQGSVPGQSSTARCPGQSSRRRFTGRIWHMLAAGLSGFIESDSAKAAYALVGDVPFFLEGFCPLGDHVTLAVGRGADGLEAFDLEVVGRE